MNNKKLNGILGDRLRMARIKKEWSQIEVAEEIGISFLSLSEYERNDRKPPTEILAYLADLYQVSISWLIGEKDDAEYTQAEKEFHSFIKDLEREWQVEELPKSSEDDVRKLRKMWELIKKENL